MKKAKNRKMPEYLVRKKRYYKMFDSIFQNQIKELSKQGQSIRGIARKLGISRQSVRKYMNGPPKYKALVQDSFNNYLKINRETIKELFFEMNGHCVPLLRKLRESMALSSGVFFNAADFCPTFPLLKELQHSTAILRR